MAPVEGQNVRNAIIPVWLFIVILIIKIFAYFQLHQFPN